MSAKRPSKLAGTKGDLTRRAFLQGAGVSMSAKLLTGQEAPGAAPAEAGEFVL